jgi:predicted outer membrane protein
VIAEVQACAVADWAFAVEAGKIAKRKSRNEHKKRLTLLKVLPP